MLGSFTKGISQLNDKPTRKYLWLGLAIAVAVFLALWSVIGFLLTNTALFSIGWLESVIDGLGAVATLVLTWFLFPSVLSAAVSFFLEDIAGCVEAKHYPGLPEVPKQDLLEIIKTSAKFLGILVVLNIAMLPFLFTGPLFPFIYYAVNGYLLGREFFELVAMRRVGETEAQAIRKANGANLFLAGLLIAFMMTVPFVNLLTPVIATAAMVHLFEGWRRSAGTGLREA